jgi:hypothetical protein
MEFRNEADVVEYINKQLLQSQLRFTGKDPFGSLNDLELLRERGNYAGQSVRAEHSLVQDHASPEQRDAKGDSHRGEP